MNLPTILDVHNFGLSLKIKGRHIKIIEGVDFTLKAGSILGLVGESGSGKSLLCKSLLALLPEGAKTSGSINLLSKENIVIDILSATEKELEDIRGKQIGILFQEPVSSMNPVLKCGQQIFDALPIDYKKNRISGNKHVIDLLDLVGLDNPKRVAKSYPHELSGGMIQKVALAAALAGEPSILIADEPFTALDVLSQIEILKIMTNLNKQLNLSLIIVLHDLELALEYSENLLVMYSGRVMEYGSTDKISTTPAHPYTKALLDVAKSYSENSKPLGIPGEIPSIISPVKGCRFHPRCKYAKEICKNAEPELKKVSQSGNVRCYFPL